MSGKSICNTDRQTDRQRPTTCSKLTIHCLRWHSLSLARFRLSLLHLQCVAATSCRSLRSCCGSCCHFCCGCFAVEVDMPLEPRQMPVPPGSPSCLSRVPQIPPTPSRSSSLPFPSLFTVSFLIGLSVCFLQQVNMVIVIVIGALPGCNLAIWQSGNCNCNCNCNLQRVPNSGKSQSHIMLPGS